MNKKLLSLALITSLIGSSFAAATEEEKQQIFKTIIKTATQQAEKQFPSRGSKDIAAAALLGAFGCTASAYAATQGFEGPFHEMVEGSPYKSMLAASLSSSLGFVGYEKIQQMRTDRKMDQKARMVTELVLAHYAEHPELLPELFPAKLTPFIDHYRTHKSILENEDTKNLLGFIALITVVASYFSNPVITAACEAAEKAYPTRGLPSAAVAGVASGLVSTGITALASYLMIKPAPALLSPASAPAPKTPSKTGTIVTTALCGAGVFALYEGWKQRRETQKARMTIEQIVKHYATHQDALTDDQIAFFAPLIAELHEKKSLNIQNPQETLSKIIFEVL